MAISLPIVSKFDDKGVNDAQLKIGAFQGIALGVFAKVGSAAVEAFAQASRAAIDFGKQSISAAIEAQAVTRQLENAAKNSGAFGEAADSIAQATKALDTHSTKLGELTGINDETINKLKSRWLTVPSLIALGTNGLNKLADVSADVAAATGKDIESIGLMFTKVAGDNETALSKLTRAGIVLSDEQKRVYNDLLASNKEAEAQAYLIEQLGIKYAGAAVAMADPMARLRITVENMQETIGMAFLPILETAVPKLQEFVNGFVTSPEFKQFLVDMGLEFENIMRHLPGIVSNLFSFTKDILPPLKALFPAVNEGLGLFAALFFGISQNDASGNTRSFAQAMQDVANGINATTGAIRDLTNWWNGLPSDLKKYLGLFQPNLFGAVGSVAKLNANGLFGNKGKNFDGSVNNDNNPFTPFAKGGIVTGPTRALIGEAGPEAVIPLDRFDDVVGKRDGGINIVVNAGMGTDGAALGEQIVTAIRKYERTSGAVFAKA